MSKYPNMLNMLKSPFSGLVSQTEVTRGCRFTQNGAEISEPFLARMVDGMRSPLVSGMVGGIMPEV